MFCIQNMPRRRYNRARRGTKRAYRRRFRKTRRYNKRGQKLYLFKRQCNLGLFTIDSILPANQGINFSLQDVPNFTEFTALYDMYKINCVKITLHPQQTQSVSIGSINNPQANARLFTAIDYNDSNAPLSIDEVRQYQSCKYTTIFRPHKRIIYKPKILDTNGFSISPWMSTTNATVNYNGLKIAAEPMGSTSTGQMVYSIEAKYYMSFKNVR